MSDSMEEDWAVKNALLIVAAIIIVWIVWGIVSKLLGGILGLVIPVLMLALFCYAVYQVYRYLSRQKI